MATAKEQKMIPARVAARAGGKRKTTPMVMVPHDGWIALTMALQASPDIAIADLVTKAKRLVENRKNYARQVFELEAKILKKCPKMDE